MPPRNRQEINRFIRVAIQRFDEAQFLFEGARFSGAVYLAGYTIECALKALLISVTPAGQLVREMASFRGKAGHDFESLRSKYLRRGGSRFPPEISSSLTLAGYWTTDLRYDPSDTPVFEAQQFLRRAADIIEWSKGRL